MNSQQSYPVSQIEPGWQLFIGNQWLDVDIVIETEAADSTRYITISFIGAPAVKFRKTKMILARPPHRQPNIEPRS